MKNSKIILSEEGSKRHLPEDLWPEILSRLPVKSLLRFRCVSKSWLSMIKHPDFCRLHLENFKDNHDENHLLVIQGSQQNCVLRCSDTFEPSTGSTPLHTLGQRGVEGSGYVVCSIDGLVLLKSCKREVSGFHKLRMWNPSIRKFHDILYLPEIEASASRSFFDEEIGLGYDPLAKDYKNVTLIFVNRIILHSVAVYTLGARSWKTIPFQGKGCSKWLCMSIVNTTRVYLRGSLYFTAYDAGRDVVELVSIDLSTELFSCTDLPGDGPLTLVDDRCTLALFNFYEGALWVLDSSSAESNPACWIRRYSFYLEVLDPGRGFLYHKKDGDVLIWWVKKISFRLLGRNTLSQQFGMVSAYNPETEEEEILLMEKGHRDVEIHHVCGYVESLNLLI